LRISARISLDGIDWVILGGESGRGAGPMRPEWAIFIRDQRRAAGVPFFFKQWGGVWKKRAGRKLEEPEAPRVAGRPAFRVSRLR